MAFFVKKQKAPEQSELFNSRPSGRQGPRKSLQSKILWGSEEQQNERAMIFEKNRRKRYDACDELVGQAGFEPATNRL